MKLYEIHEAVRALEDQIVIDPETGEYLCDMDAIDEKLHGLEMEWQRVLEYLAKAVLNTRAEAEAIRGEEVRLKLRRETLERKDRRLMQVLERECPESADLGVAVLRYRKVRRVDVTDEAAAVKWLKARKLTYCINQPEPTVYKAEIKKLIAAGKQIPGCAIVEDRAVSLR